MASRLPWLCCAVLLLGAHLASSAEGEEAEEGAEELAEGTADADFEVVSLDLGDVKGFREYSSRGLPFYSFLGIPYAKPPVGKLRFKNPEVHEGWDGILDGSVARPVCSQIDINSYMVLPDAKYTGEEDCLYLNIYTPEPNLDLAELPVLVYFHGGHFVSGGASDYEPYDLLNAPVILVVIQYRLGVLGFMSTEDEVMPGNLGLKDQTMALKWIHHFIENFGGSPLKITLFGSGSGSASVHYQTLSHHTIGLFSRAILQSGTALCPWAQGGVHKEAAYHIGKHFKCLPEEEEEENKEGGEEEEGEVKETEGEKEEDKIEEKEEGEKEEGEVKETKSEKEEDKIEEKEEGEKEEDKIEEKEEGKIEETKDGSGDGETETVDPEEEERKAAEKLKNEELLQCLQEVDVEKLTNSAKMFYMWSYLPVIFGPRVDYKYLPETPEFLLDMARHKRLELIIGTNKDDGSLLTNSIFISEGRRMALKHHFPLIGPISLEFSDDDVAPLNMSIKAYDKYSGGIKADASEAYNMTRLYTDRHFGVCSDLTADFHYMNNQRYKKNVYLYEYEHRGQRSVLDIFGLNFGKEWVSQGDELFSLFPFNKTKDVPFDEDDEAMKEAMIKMWYFFADTGNPTPNGTFDFTWEPYTKEDRRHLKLTTTPSMEDDNRAEAREFWTTLPTRQNMFLNKEYFKKILFENSPSEESNQENGEEKQEENLTNKTKDEL